MTIKQCIAKKGWIYAAINHNMVYRSMDVDIDFENDGIIDETEFCIAAYNTSELNELFADFCKENGIPNNTVESITIVRVYETDVEIELY